MAPSPFPAPPRASRGNFIGCAVVLFLIGGVWLAILYFTVIAPDWRLNHQYVGVQCVVLEKRLAERSDDDDTSYRPEIYVRYMVDGREHKIWIWDKEYSTDQNAQQHILDQFAVGKEYPLWYDPANPDKAVLVRSDNSASYWYAVIPVSIIALGLLVVVGAFRPPIAAPPTAAAQQDPIRSLSQVPGLADVAAYLQRNNPAASPSLLTVPDPTAFQQPGQALAFGLRPGMPTPVALAKAGGLLLVGAVALIAALCTLGRPGVATAVLGVIAGFALFFGWRSWLLVARVGPTGVELSTHPIRPGEALELAVTQPGPLRLRRLQVHVLCEESVTYEQGTVTRSEKKCVCRQVMLTETDVEVGRDAPVVLRGGFTLPPDAMHSFTAQHNGVQWKIVVHGEPRGLPQFDRDFPVVVGPARDASRDQGVAPS